VTDLSGISAPMRRTMLAMPLSEGWATFSELPDGVSAMALTLLSIRTDPWIERRRTSWGGEPGQKRGSGYEYRITPRGRDVRTALGIPA
jgi:hypothetical protein